MYVVSVNAITVPCKFITNPRGIKVWNTNIMLKYNPNVYATFIWIIFFFLFICVQTILQMFGRNNSTSGIKHTSFESKLLCFHKLPQWPSCSTLQRQLGQTHIMYTRLTDIDYCAAHHMAHTWHDTHVGIMKVDLNSCHNELKSSLSSIHV